MQLTVLVMFYLPQLFKTQEEISAVEKQLQKEEMALGRHEEKLVMFLKLKIHESSYDGDFIR